MQNDTKMTYGADQASHQVEFYPAIDDLVYISLTTSKNIAKKPFSIWAYWAFLFVNGIVFPAFLFANEYFAAAIAVFFLNLAAVLYLIPRANSDHYRSHFHSSVPDYEKDLVTIELSDDGIRYSTEKYNSFIKWSHIKKIEETPEAIYFFFDGSGWAVRKTGFAGKEQETEFVRFGRSRHAVAKKEIQTQ